MDKFLTRCQDCEECTKKNGKYICRDMWDKPIETVDECPLGITVDEVQEELEKTKNFKIDHQTGKKKTENAKPKTVKISQEKESFFSEIAQFLEDSGKNYQVLKENKLFSIQIGEKTFKLDLIEQRKPKK